MSGIITELLVEDGTTVTPGMKIFKMQSGDVPAPTATSDPEKTADPPAPETPEPAATITTSAPKTEQLVGTPIPTIPPPSAEPPKTPMQSIPVAAIKHASFIHKAEIKVSPIA